MRRPARTSYSADVTKKDRALVGAPATAEVRRQIARRVSAPVKRAVAKAIERDKTALRKLANY